jgi:hypothetical protein
MALAIISDETKQKIKKVNSFSYPITKIIPIESGIKINEVLPFRVRFSTIGIPSAYAGVPGIGIQIIGINNYIL